MLVIKRDGKTREKFDKNKIEQAILKAMIYGSGNVDEQSAKDIAIEIENHVKFIKTWEITVKYIEELVYRRLVAHKLIETAKCYEGYRALAQFKRQTNTSDDNILGLIHGTNLKTMQENSNKDANIAPTQRDLVAGEVSKDIARRKLLPTRIIQAHDNGILHYHDMDYAMQPIFNCCLVNIGDMLDNGTVINGNMIESPQSFQKACTIMTQIMAQIASGQYGGQSMNIKHLGRYLRRSYAKAYKTSFVKNLERTNNDFELAHKWATEDAIERRKEELKNGVQTIQYQINTLQTSNGQNPFVTLFLEIEKDHEFEEEIVLIIEEMLKQRLEGIKNEAGVYVTPAFPKLVYVLDEHNCLEGGKYDYVTELALKCSSKRMYPDYISAKRMREIYEGNVFSPMGCRSFLSPWKDENGEYKFEGRFNMGVVSINLPQIGIIANGDEEKMWKLLDQRLLLCKDALMCRYNLLKGTTSDISPIHWQHGGIARLKKGETIDHLLENGYATISLGYVGLYELTKIMTGDSHTKDKEFALRVIKRLKQATEDWKKETGLGFGLYGTPAESLAGRFAEIDKANYGEIKDITDKGFYTNSYHVDVREKIDAFEKLAFESEFQPISSGGCISYIEIPNMKNNLEALRQLIKFMYNNISYSEWNTKSDYCHKCGFDGEIQISEDLQWVCPQCGNKDKKHLTVVRRTCGYLGSNFWGEGRTRDIKNRVTHL